MKNNKQEEVCKRQQHEWLIRKDHVLTITLLTNEQTFVPFNKLPAEQQEVTVCLNIILLLWWEVYSDTLKISLRFGEKLVKSFDWFHRNLVDIQLNFGEGLSEIWLHFGSDLDEFMGWDLVKIWLKFWENLIEFHMHFSSDFRLHFAQIWRRRLGGNLSYYWKQLGGNFGKDLDPSQLSSG